MATRNHAIMVPMFYLQVVLEQPNTSNKSIK